MRRVTPATILIVLIFGAASLLAWQAHDAARSHRRSAERVLDDYVQFAGWEFARLAEAALTGALREWSQAGAAPPSPGLPSPEEFNARPTCKCQDLKATATFQVVGGRVERRGEPLPPGADAWILDFARRAAPREPAAMRIVSAGGEPRVMVARLGHRHGNAPGPVEGFVMAAAPVQKLLREIVERRPLLPPTLAGATNELVAVDVQSPDGASLLRDAGSTSGARMDGQLALAIGGLEYTVRLRPDAATRLVIGGLPGSRLPLLIGLLGLTAALAAAALLQLRREHQLARVRADFVSSVSHELRTPLAQIRLFSETLLLNRVRSPAEGRRALEIIQQEARRLSHLVDNVLFFSRAERGIERVSAAPAAVAPLTAELVEAFEPLARSARSRIRLDVAGAPHAFVDPAAFRQILLNLLDNAVKYGAAGQTIVVAVERRPGGVAVSVADEGPGVPAEARTRIWAPYARLVTASTSAIAGTGIGLAVVRRLVELHGGSVHVEEAPGGGARFVALFREAAAAA
jgi:signal transduction histidine kinase